MDLTELLQDSLDAARRQTIEWRSKGLLHRARSRAWVEALADGFRAHYAHDPAVRVFSKHYAGNKQDFGLNELLYDVTVCRVGSVESARQRKSLLFVREALWQVESELARDSRQALIDMNKLVLGSARNKLFVGPQVHDRERYLGVLLPAADVCSGQVFAALISHPAQWEAGEASVDVWRFDGGGWAPL